MAKPMKECNEVTCRTLIPFDVQYCTQHLHLKRESRRNYDRNREREDAKYRGIYHSSRWRKLRKQILMRDDYLCQSCLDKGLYETADVVHHITELKQDISKAYEPGNLTAWCHECHNRHHKSDTKHEH